ncbi:hypothetical protein, partial [Calderihabitans maritimus]|uniref:hypothetical protein n=1 Tax=Calderihabitans maritimus TaxID=1246530 RepID=UPI001EE02C37
VTAYPARPQKAGRRNVKGKDPVRHDRVGRGRGMWVPPKIYYTANNLAKCHPKKGLIIVRKCHFYSEDITGPGQL